MSLRRAGIARKTALKRSTPMPRGKRELRGRVTKTVRRQRDTGPSPATRALLLDRAAGCCEICGRLLHDGTSWLGPRSVHHRRPRGAGGSRWAGINLPSNLLLLCGDATSPDGCHAFVEAHRTSAYEEGWLVHQGQDSAAVPVTVLVTTALRLHPQIATRRVFLTVDGDYEEAAA